MMKYKEVDGFDMNGQPCKFKVIINEEKTPLQALKTIDGYLGRRDTPAYFNDFAIVSSALKALEIIKEKPVVALVDYKYTYEEWLELVDEKDKDLFKNKEEYDLLKEVLL